MTVIELVRYIISNYPKIQEFTNEIHIDFTESDPDNYGLSSTGDQLIKEDMLGNQKRKHSFVLYAINGAYEDYNRLLNSNFLLELGYWLEGAASGQEIEVNIGEMQKTGELTGMSSANAMLYSIPTGDINDGVTYQIQIYANYNVLESEEI